MLILASVVATVSRYVALRSWVFARAHHHVDGPESAASASRTDCAPAPVPVSSHPA